MLCACAVDNVILRDPPVLGVPLLAGLNLVPGTPQQPCPGETSLGLVEHARLRMDLTCMLMTQQHGANKSLCRMGCQCVAGPGEHNDNCALTLCA